MDTEQNFDTDAGGPTSLQFVGPATMAVIDRSSFDLRDIATRGVSYRELVDAGVNPGVAERLRQEYSLVWSFEWLVGGTDLACRAVRLQELTPAERSWIAASADGVDSEPVVEAIESDHELAGETADPADRSNPLEDRGWPSVDPDEQVDADETDVCPRCDSELVTYVLGDNESTFCDACGYVGVAAELGGETPAWGSAVERLLSGR